jgi:hypothetical protein
VSVRLPGHFSSGPYETPSSLVFLFSEHGRPRPCSVTLPSRPEQGGRRGGDVSHRILERRRRPTDAPTASSALARWAPALAVSTHSVCSLDLLMCYEFDCYPCVPKRHYFLLFHGLMVYLTDANCLHRLSPYCCSTSRRQYYC